MQNTQSTSHILSIIENASYVAMFIASMQWLGLSVVSVIVLTVFIFVDIVLGILKTAVLYGGCAIKSRVLERGIISKALLIIVPLVLAGMGRGINIDSTIVAQSFLNVLILSEAYSVIGNIYAIRTGKERNEFDAVSFVLGSIQAMLRKFIRDDSL